MKNVAIIVVTVAAFAAGLFGIKMFLLPDGTPADGAAAELAAADSVTAAQALEEATGQPADSLVALPFPNAPIGELERLRAQLTLTQEQLPALLQRLDELESDLNAREERHERARELSNTVSRLEGEELTALLVQLDRRVLTDIYAQASPRNRSKLLQALPARAAAALVEQIASSSSRPQPELALRRTASADSTAAPPAQ